MLRRALAAALLAVALVACGDDQPALSPPVILETPRPGITDRTVKARLTMTLQGAETAEIETDTTLKIVEIHGDEMPSNTWFLSVSAGQPVEAPGGAVVLFTADMGPGLYQGPGTYTLEDDPAQPSPSASTSAIESAAYVQLSEPSGVRRYEDMREPCTLEVTQQQRTGTVTCPALADADGDVVELRWSWRLT